MKVANDTFFDEAGFCVSSKSPFIILEHEEFDAMNRQFVEANFQDGFQEAGAVALPCILYSDASEPDTLIGAS